jgi:hypothetical protein
MYMYYLLGYKYFGDLDLMEKFYEEKDPFNRDEKTKHFIGFGNLLKNIDEKLRKRVIKKLIIVIYFRTFLQKILNGFCFQAREYFHFNARW